MLIRVVNASPSKKIYGLFISLFSLRAPKKFDSAEAGKRKPKQKKNQNFKS